MERKRIEIEYCVQCKWLLRSAWMAQEILSTFEGEVLSVSLIPSKGGVFEIRADGVVLWSREEKGRFPNIKELKQAVRNHVSPSKDLGHIDK